MDEGAKLHLKEWLIVQIESGNYEGLSWEDDSKTMFRIPWKHAAKKDYKQTEDAALFKAWAVYKGKYREGRDRADPTMWKTRLRCALNKSSDFQEVSERNQLDITEPYKVYRIQYPDGSRPAGPPEAPQTRSPAVNQDRKSCRSDYYLDKQLQNEDKKEEKTPTDDPMREHMYCHLTETQRHHSSPASRALLSPSFTISDLRMQVKLFYQGGLVMKVTTRSPEGCFILEGRVPLGNERIYGPCSAQQLSLPSPAAVGMSASLAAAMSRLHCHLERGVLLWVAPDGLFIKRFCQGRVYWSGPLAPHADRPNKLEREKTRKLLDVPAFITALHSCLEGRGPTPSYKIELCFGEEYPDPSVPKNRKLIMAQVVPLFAVELLEKFNLGENEEESRTPTNSSEENEMEKD